MTSFDGKCQNVQMLLFLHFLFSLSNNLCERKYHTQRHRNGQAHNYRRNPADLTKNHQG